MALNQHAQSVSTFRSTLRRLLAISFAWLVMGLMLGLLAGKGSGVVGLAAALTAGILVLTPTGLLLGLLGGRWDESLVGGMLGMLLGVGFAMLQGRPDPREAAALGLACGAFMGATAANVFYRVPRFIMSRFATREIPTAS